MMEFNGTQVIPGAVAQDSVAAGKCWAADASEPFVPARLAQLQSPASLGKDWLARVLTSIQRVG
jgi:hypothetical protein